MQRSRHRLWHGRALWGSNGQAICLTGERLQGSQLQQECCSAMRLKLICERVREPPTRFDLWPPTGPAVATDCQNPAHTYRSNPRSRSRWIFICHFRLLMEFILPRDTASDEYVWKKYLFINLLLFSAEVKIKGSITSWCIITFITSLWIFISAYWWHNFTRGQ